MPAIAYHFRELGDVSCAEIARANAKLLIGRTAVNASWDSGLLSRPDWGTVNGYACSPPVPQAMIDDWPVSHDDFCDEWWVFDHDVPHDFRVVAFCNYCGMTISRYKKLDFDKGCRLDQYLKAFNPLAVFGSNELGYFIERA